MVENKKTNDYEAYVTVINGETVLVDPAGYRMMQAVNKQNCIATFEMNADRIAHFKNRIGERQMDPKTVVIVIINVDAPYGGDLADMLMPGHDWQQFRDNGEVPFARGLAMREGVQEYVKLFDAEASQKIETVAGIPVVVIDYSVAEIFSA